MCLTCLEIFCDCLYFVFVFCVLCSVFCVLCSVFCVLCFMFCVLCFVRNTKIDMVCQMTDLYLRTLVSGHLQLVTPVKLKSDSVTFPVLGATINRQSKSWCPELLIIICYRKCSHSSPFEVQVWS